LIPLCMGEVDKVRDFAIAGYFKFSWSIITEDWSYIHWLNRLDDQSFGDTMAQIYTTPDAAIIETGVEGGLNSNNSKKEADRKKIDIENESLATYKEHATLDDEEQWTCNPGTKAELRSKDELYDRRNDPWQLNNVIEQHPDIANQLLTKLTDFMADLAEN
ncbi:MAG: sulfatase, partial [Mailhella sp.]|nr:sulfatase [Mailhella sp.]